ncbi:MAG: hypothetical protein ACOX6T_24710, partial [Myxococcales bacterium]
AIEPNGKPRRKKAPARGRTARAAVEPSVKAPKKERARPKSQVAPPAEGAAPEEAPARPLGFRARQKLKKERKAALREAAAKRAQKR